MDRLVVDVIGIDSNDLRVKEYLYISGNYWDWMLMIGIIFFFCSVI